MPHTYEYAVLRVVPRVERGEHLNAGVILYSQRGAFLEARAHLDRDRLRALDATVDLDAVCAHLEAVANVCRGGVDSGPAGRTPLGERFRWLTSPRSTVVQPSPVHTGLADDLSVELDLLMRRMVLPLA